MNQDCLCYVLCKITFALNTAVTDNGRELTHNDNNIIVTCCTIPK